MNLQIDSLTGDYRSYSKKHHFHFMMWEWTVVVHTLLNKAAEKLPPEEKKTVLAFWRAAITEYQIYYVYPLLSLTSCNGREYRSVTSMDFRSFTANGISLEGVSCDDERRSLRTLLNPLALEGLALARTAYSWKQSFDSYQSLKFKSDIAIWAVTKPQFEALNEVFPKESKLSFTYFTHNPALVTVIESRIGLKAALIKNEGSQKHFPGLRRKLLKEFTKLAKGSSFTCSEHEMRIPSDMLIQSFTHFLSSRWPSYFAFKGNFDRLSQKLRLNGFRGLVVGHDRNLRERVLVESFKTPKHPTFIVEPSLLDPDTSWTFGSVVDHLLLDSDFTVRELARTGHPEEKLSAVGHSGMNWVKKPDTKKEFREKYGIKDQSKVLFYATQDVYDGSAGTKRRNPHLEKMKKKEMNVVLRMAEEKDFKIVIKPHRDENIDFYEEHCRGGRVIILDQETLAQDVIRSSDFVITRFSTVGYEAMAFGLPVYYLNFYHHCPTIACFSEDWIFEGRDEHRAEKTFREFWEVAFTPDYLSKVKEFAWKNGWVPEANHKIFEVIEEKLLSMPSEASPPEVTPTEPSVGEAKTSSL